MPASALSASLTVRRIAIYWGLGAACVILLTYALLVIEHAVALHAGTVELSTSLLAPLTSEAFMFGPWRTHILPWYQAIPWRMAMHMAMGGLSLGLGLLQFVPTFRRHHPAWHRAAGAIVWVATAISMGGALGFLVHVPLTAGSSGPAFQIALWAESLVMLFMLYQAIIAAIARDFRSHMVWMAMVFSGLATAPMERVDWVVLHQLWPSMDLDTLNLGITPWLVPQTALAMALWLAYVGDRDLPARPSQKGRPIPLWLVWFLCGAAALVALHEGVLVVQGWDVFDAWRPKEVRPPAVAGLWAIAAVAALLRVPLGYQRAFDGQRPGIDLVVAALLAALGALILALAIDPVSREAFSERMFWLCDAVVLVMLLAQAYQGRVDTAGRNSWGVILCAALLLPLLMTALVPIGLAGGASFVQARLASMIVSLAGLLYFGVVLAYGARVRLWASVPSRSALPSGQSAR